MLSFIRKCVNKTRAKILFKKKSGSIVKILRINGIDRIQVGKGVRILENSRIDIYKTFNNQKFNPALILKDGCIIANNFTCIVTDQCVIGENTIIAHNVSIITENHGINPESQVPFHAQDLVHGDIVIGSNCWIGCNAVLLPGCQLGDNCVVAANAVVNKKFGNDTMVGGVPARVLKRYDRNRHEWVRADDKTVEICK